MLLFAASPFRYRYKQGLDLKFEAQTEKYIWYTCWAQIYFMYMIRDSKLEFTEKVY